MRSLKDGVDRRDFVKAAVAIGGVNALAACVKREGKGEGGPETASGTPEYARGPSDPAVVPERQFAWNEYLARDPHENTVQPRHQVLLFLRYRGDAPPTDDDRSTVESALTTIERAFQRGTGGKKTAATNSGILFLLGYTPSYFDRLYGDRPDGIDLPTGASIMDDLGEDSGTASDHDAFLLLASDFGSLLLSAEEALFGDLNEANGLALETDLSGVFEVAERRTGVIGRGMPAEHTDHEEIPDHAPLSMGFKSGFKDALPSEEKVSIPDGPFADGTTGHVSRLEIDLDDWYDHSHDEQVGVMFSPHHDKERLGETGEDLGGSSRVTEEMTENLEETAREHGCLGHSQKTARARDEDFEPTILRRSEGVATDVDRPAFNFFAIQRTVADFVETRKAMESDDVHADVDADMDGIVNYLSARDRTTVLFPPRSQRALPTPTGVP